MFRVSKQAVSALTGSVAMFALGVMLFAQATAPPDKSVPFKSTMANPYRLVESWPKLGSIPPGPAIGIIPDEKGGVWLLHRSDPPLLHIDAAGNVYLAGIASTGGGNYVSKLNPAGSPIFTTYFGGTETNVEWIEHLAVDLAGNIHVVGLTDASNFPTTAGAFQTAFQGGFDDGFLATWNATGDALARFFTPDVVQEELPNRLVPNGATRDLAAILQGAERGKQVLRKQVFELHNVISSGLQVAVEDGVVRSARIAFGGMAATPKRAARAEAALVGQPWTAQTIANAQGALAEDFAPITDWRASAEYRAQAARNLLKRFYLESAGEPARLVREVA